MRTRVIWYEGSILVWRYCRFMSEVVLRRPLYGFREYGFRMRERIPDEVIIPASMMMMMMIM